MPSEHFEACLQSHEMGFLWNDVEEPVPTILYLEGVTVYGRRGVTEKPETVHNRDPVARVGGRPGAFPGPAASRL